jgi:hypothetical protein
MTAYLSRRWRFTVMALVASWIFLLGVHAQSVAAIHRKQADLNGDGKLENIVLESTDNGDYTLKVNGLAVKGGLDNVPLESLAIVDIDTRDKRKEISIDTMGPSDDPACHLYAYDGRALIKVAALEGFRTYSGVGFVYTVDWMGFWSRTEKFALNSKTHLLARVPQELYNVAIELDGKVKNVECVVREAFPIFSARTGNQVLATLAPKSTIQILACDPSPRVKRADGSVDSYSCAWYLIRSSTGLLGWARLGTFMPKVDGLMLAD